MIQVPVLQLTLHCNKSIIVYMYILHFKCEFGGKIKLNLIKTHKRKYYTLILSTFDDIYPLKERKRGSKLIVVGPVMISTVLHNAI